MVIAELDRCGTGSETDSRL